jgi:hypothetical protein
MTQFGRAHRSTFRRWLWTAIGLGLLLLPAAAVSAQPPDIAAVIQREIALLRFYGGGSALSEPEQKAAADMVQLEMQQAPQAEIAADAGAAKLLRTLAQAQPPTIALARESGRLNAQLHDAVSPALRSQQAMEAQIIAAHDPAIVFDPAHKRLVSEQTLRILQHADELGASTFGVPAPGPDFVDLMRKALPGAWPNMDDGMQDSVAHAERDLPYANAFLQGIDPQKRAAIVQTYRTKIMAAPDAAGQQLNLAEVMAVVGRTAFHHTQSGSGTQGGTHGGTQGGVLAGRLRMQDLANRQLEGAMRSYSPTCNVTRPDAMANFASCHP